jgi:hypothetical protein
MQVTVQEFDTSYDAQNANLVYLDRCLVLNHDTTTSSSSKQHDNDDADNRGR